jgi:hypothetical protein
MRFQVLTATNMKMAVFSDFAPCGLVDTDLRSRGDYCLHHHGYIKYIIDDSCIQYKEIRKIIA